MNKNSSSLEQKVRAIALQEELARNISGAGYTLLSDDSKTICGRGEFYRAVRSNQTGKSLKLRFAYDSDGRNIARVVLEGKKEDEVDFSHLHVCIEDFRRRHYPQLQLQVEFPFNGAEYLRKVREGDSLKKMMDYARVNGYDSEVMENTS